MSGKFKFRNSCQSDLIFQADEKTFYNFGYHYIMHFFPALWFYHKQVTQLDLFRDVKIRKGECLPLEYELTKELEEIIDASKNLPLTIEAFNSNLGRIGLDSFKSGLPHMTYNWQLGEDGLFHLNAREIDREHRPVKNHQDILALSGETDGVFIKDYLEFLRTDVHMNTCYGWSCEVMRKLKGN